MAWRDTKAAIILFIKGGLNATTAIDEAGGSLAGTPDAGRR
jgi:hypothetical protein